MYRFAHLKFFVSPGGQFIGVFDGHGGSRVSRYLKEKLYPRFLKCLGKECEGRGEEVEQPSIESVKGALGKSLEKTNDEVMAVSR